MTLYLEVTADVIAHNQQNFFNSLFFTFSSSFKPFINILTLRSSSGKQFFSKRPKLFWQGIPGKVGFLWLVKTNPGEQQVDPITFLSVVVMPCAFNLYFALRESFAASQLSFVMILKFRWKLVTFATVILLFWWMVSKPLRKYFTWVACGRQW